MSAQLAAEPASASHYYEIKEAFERFGTEGLAPQRRHKPRSTRVCKAAMFPFVEAYADDQGPWMIFDIMPRLSDSRSRNQIVHIAGRNGPECG